MGGTLFKLSQCYLPYIFLIAYSPVIAMVLLVDLCTRCNRCTVRLYTRTCSPHRNVRDKTHRGIVTIPLGPCLTTVAKHDNLPLLAGRGMAMVVVYGVELFTLGQFMVGVVC